VSFKVEFTNIVVKDGYIYADAYDFDFNIGTKIKLSTTKPEYYINGEPEDFGRIVVGFWALQDRIKESGTLNSREAVVWF